jgi:hypothetical protein
MKKSQNISFKKEMLWMSKRELCSLFSCFNLTVRLILDLKIHKKRKVAIVESKERTIMRDLLMSPMRDFPGGRVIEDKRPVVEHIKDLIFKETGISFTKEEISNFTLIEKEISKGDKTLTLVFHSEVEREYDLIVSDPKLRIAYWRDLFSKPLHLPETIDVQYRALEKIKFID